MAKCCITSIWHVAVHLASTNFQMRATLSREQCFDGFRLIGSRATYRAATPKGFQDSPRRAIRLRLRAATTAQNPGCCLGCKIGCKLAAALHVRKNDAGGMGEAPSNPHRLSPETVCGIGPPGADQADLGQGCMAAACPGSLAESGRDREAIAGWMGTLG